ncbi:TIGR01906 family membrane protein [Chloroflexota bacterium]
MRIPAIIAKWLFILCLPVLLLTASIAVAVNSLWLYQYGFQKYHVSQTTGLAPSELEKAASALIHYFNSDEEYISVTVVQDGKPFELFTDDEAAHFRDVKELFRLDYGALLGTLLYALAYAGVYLFWRKDTHRLARSVVWGSGITLALMLVLGLGTLLDFNQLFLQFHFLVFSNTLWSAQGYMLLIFPGGFWYDVTLFCALATVAGAIILGGVGIWWLVFSRDRANQNKNGMNVVVLFMYAA